MESPFPQPVTSSRNYRDRVETVITLEEDAVITDPMDTLEQEVALAQEQVKVLSEELKKVKLESPPSKPLLKPRDITLLELKHLQGLEAEGRLNVFLSQVEAASNIFEERKRIVMSRVDPQLAMYLQTIFNRQEFENWETFKIFFKDEFSDANLDKAYACISQIKYDWLDDPQSFANNIKCRYSVLEAKFPSGSLPRMDKVIKKKLLLGLPGYCRERLEIFVEDSIPLKRFIERVETERLIAMSKESDPIKVVDEKLSPSSSCKPTVEPQVAELSKQMEKMEQNLRELRFRTRTSSYGNRKYCPYCQLNNHSVRDCKRRPEPGSCYDCMKLGCYRGKPNCPGRRGNVR